MNVEKRETLCTIVGNTLNKLYSIHSTVVQPRWKTEWRILKNLKIELSYDQEISLLGLYSKEMKTIT